MNISIISSTIVMGLISICLLSNNMYASEPPSATEPVPLLKEGESLLRDNVTIVPSFGGHCVAFIQEGKIGFALNSSNLMVYRSNNLAIVKKNGKWGAYNCSTFEIDVPCIYDKLTPFRDGKSTAILNGETFTIDINGNRLD